jgi:hypothetical protein
VLSGGVQGWDPVDVLTVDPERLARSCEDVHSWTSAADLVYELGGGLHEVLTVV